MKTRIVALICGTSNCWKVAEPSDPAATTQERVVSLKIQGDAKHGYHLVMSPEGCFAADSWHPTIEDALDTAQRLFEVRPDEWS